jgi:hypothetical protein
MKVRMLIDVGGTFHNVAGGVKRGDVVEVDDDNARRYMQLGYAQSASLKELGQPYLPAH